MATIRFSTFSVFLLVAMQVGCAAMPGRADGLRSSRDVLHPTCDTSVRYIYLAARFRNTTGEEIRFNLVGDRGPPFDLWYLGYRVHSSAPGETFRLVHNSGQDSDWTRSVSIAPGDSADFNIPIFGLRPADYYRYFQIELRDSKRRSYWTRVFELCSVSQAACGCPRIGELGVRSQPLANSCPAAPLASGASNVTPVDVGASCQ